MAFHDSPLIDWIRHGQASLFSVCQGQCKPFNQFLIGGTLSALDGGTFRKNRASMFMCSTKVKDEEDVARACVDEG